MLNMPMDQVEQEEETPLNFEEFIKLNEPLTPQEAIDKLCEFHNASPEAVINIFSNLRNYHKKDTTTDTIIFKESISNGGKCIKIVCSDKDGYKWNSLINSTDGSLIQRTG